MVEEPEPGAAVTQEEEPGATVTQEPQQEEPGAQPSSKRPSTM